jgi:hypothetical protein
MATKLMLALFAARLVFAQADRLQLAFQAP